MWRGPGFLTAVAAYICEWPRHLCVQRGQARAYLKIDNKTSSLAESINKLCLMMKWNLKQNIYSGWFWSLLTRVVLRFNQTFNMRQCRPQHGELVSLFWHDVKIDAKRERFVWKDFTIWTDMTVTSSIVMLRMRSPSLYGFSARSIKSRQ